jgi:hypothetical protein
VVAVHPNWSSRTANRPPIAARTSARWMQREQDRLQVRIAERAGVGPHAGRRRDREIATHGFSLSSIIVTSRYIHASWPWV